MTKQKTINPQRMQDVLHYIFTGKNPSGRVKLTFTHELKIHIHHDANLNLTELFKNIRKTKGVLRLRQIQKVSPILTKLAVVYNSDESKPWTESSELFWAIRQGLNVDAHCTWDDD
jgi:hypothetical protein